MAIDLRGHTVPAGTDFPKRDDLLRLSASINAVKTVANMTEAAQYITALQSASLPTEGVTIFNTADKRYYGRISGAWAQIYTAANDTKWVSIPGAPTNGTYQYRIIYGIICQVRSITVANFGAGGTFFPFFTLPPDARPSTDVPMAAYGNGAQPATASIAASGNVNLRNNHTAAVSAMTLSATYLLG